MADAVPKDEDDEQMLSSFHERISYLLEGLSEGKLTEREQVILQRLAERSPEVAHAVACLTPSTELERRRMVKAASVQRPQVVGTTRRRKLGIGAGAAAAIAAAVIAGVISQSEPDRKLYASATQAEFDETVELRLEGRGPVELFFRTEHGEERRLPPIQLVKDDALVWRAPARVFSGDHFGEVELTARREAGGPVLAKLQLQVSPPPFILAQAQLTPSVRRGPAPAPGLVLPRPKQGQSLKLRWEPSLKAQGSRFAEVYILGPTLTRKLRVDRDEKGNVEVLLKPDHLEGAQRLELRISLSIVASFDIAKPTEP